MDCTGIQPPDSERRTSNTERSTSEFGPSSISGFDVRSSLQKLGAIGFGRGPARWRLYALILLGVALLAAGLYGLSPVSVEGRARDVICLRLLANSTDGRQALVSSAWWAPLPTLIRLPLVFVLRPMDLPLASLLISIGFGLIILAFLSRILDGWKAGWAGVLIVSGLALNPHFLSECLNGSSSTFVVFLMLLITHGMVLWKAARKLRGLSFVGLGSALLLISSLELALWVIAVLVLLVVDELAGSASRKEKEAVVILALFPALYAVGLWMLTNWLIMGDGLYFLRSLFQSGPERGVIAFTNLRETGFLYLFALLSLPLLAMSAPPRRRPGLYLAMISLTPVGVAGVLSAHRCLWEPAPVLFSLLSLGVLALGYCLRAGVALASRRRMALALMPAVFSLVSWTTLDPSPGLFAASADTRTQIPEGATWLPRIGQHVLRQSRYAKVFVCGYGSFALMGAKEDPLFVHSLDFNFYEAVQDYKGHALFLLVHRPVGRMAMDSIHWKYDALFTHGAYSTLYYGDWGEWRLFEIIQVPKEETSSEE